MCPTVIPAAYVTAGKLARNGSLAFGLLLAQGLAAADNPVVVFVSRSLEERPASQRVRPVEVARYGKLVLKDASGFHFLVNGRDAAADTDLLDVLDPEVSHDVTRVLFAGFSHAEDGFRIHEIQLDGSGLRQVTRSDRKIEPSRYGEAYARLAAYDDYDPCYLPDGRICFVSTRYPGIAPDGRLRTTNLYVVNPDGTDLHRITSERFGADTPAVNPLTGHITYSRWWRTPEVRSELEPIAPVLLGSPDYERAIEESAGTVAAVLRGIADDEFPGVNNWFLASIGPDGSDVAMQSGLGLDRQASHAWRPSYGADGTLIALFTAETPLQGSPGWNGLRRIQPGTATPEPLGGPQAFARPGSPPEGSRNDFFYASAASLPDGRLLVTGSRGNSWDRNVYIQSAPNEIPALYLTLGPTSELDAVPVIERPAPPIIPDQATDRPGEDTPATLEEARVQGGELTFRSENVHSNAPVDSPLPTAPPIGRRLAIEFYMSPQRGGLESADPAILIGSREIGPDGRTEMTLPGGVPLFEVLRRPDGQIFHVGGLNFNRAGANRACVGCHAGHSMMAVPDDPSWTNLAPSATVIASSSARPDPSSPVSRPFASQPHAVVDRRTAPGVSEWLAEGGEAVSHVELRWPVPIRARQAVVYGTQLPLGGGTVRVNSFKVATFLEGKLQEEIPVAERAGREGTPVSLDAEREIDALRVTIDASAVTGLIDGVRRAALAEVEVIAKAAGGSAPRVLFAPGNANCDGVVDLADAVTILNSLFLTPEDLCCAPAADVSGDEVLDITDPIVLLGRLFRGLAAPLPDLGRCERREEGALVCDTESCPE